MSEGNGSFESLLATVPKREKQDDTFQIALKDYFPESDAVLTFHKIRASLLFGDTLLTLVERIKNQRCIEEDATILEMAFIIACHEAPKPERPELLVPGYILIFASLDEVQKYLFVQEFKNKGGGEFLEKALQMIGAKKNGTRTENPAGTGRNGKSSGSRSATSNATRPKRPSALKTSPRSRPTSS